MDNYYPQNPYNTSQNTDDRKWGAISAGIGGVADMYGSYQNMVNQANAINTQSAPQTFDAYGDPSYNLGNLDASANMKAYGAQTGEILSGVGKGASTGAAIGSIVPGVGTVIGGVVGGIVGGISSAIGGGARKREQQKRIRLARLNLEAGQRMYGENKQQFLNTQLGAGDYNNRNNAYDRLTNLYMAQSGQQQ